MIIIFEGDDAMFGDAEHYKYLTNEADLNNAADESIALTPKTPKKVSVFFKTRTHSRNEDGMEVMRFSASFFVIRTNLLKIGIPMIRLFVWLLVYV